VDLLTGVKVGDYVLIHAGFAITIMDEDQALETLQIMEEVGIL
jgi:hydrogenase expression/formation protein HypC